MVKLSKQAYRVFERNMRKSWGLLRLQFYANDLVRTGGKESIGKVSQFLSDMLSYFGMGPYKSFEDLVDKEFTPLIERELIPKIQASLAGVPEKELERKGEKWLAENIDEFEQVKKDIERLMVAVEYVLLEQALVTAITAFEVYIRDVTSEVVAKNVFIEKRFTTELFNKLNYQAIVDSKRILGLAVGSVAAGSYDFNNPKNLKNHIGKLVGKWNPFTESKKLKAFAMLLAYRHLIVHRAGIVDRKFIKDTGYKGREGAPIKLSYLYVEEALVLLEKLASDVQNGLMRQKAPHP